MENSTFKIHPREQVWVDNYHFLLTKGYQLRKRYRPGWIGSWVTQGVSEEKVMSMGKKRYTKFEDSVVSQTRVVDATRISDSIVVALKHITPPKKGETPNFYRHSLQELPIMELLASPELRDHPCNPCPLLLDSFPLPNSEDGTILVMTLTRYPAIPRIHLVVEALSFIRQMLEALVLLHEHNIAHRDICLTNVMMDTSLYPRGMNPLVNYSFQERHLPPEPPHLDRVDVARVRYYLIDYGYSLRFPSREGRFQVINSGGQIRLAEFYEKDKPFGKRSYALHDPFKADVKQLAVLIETLFGFSVPFLLPLFRAIDLPPQERPDASAALEMFKQLTQNLSRPQLLRHVGQSIFYQVSKDDDAFQRWWWFFRGTCGWARVAAKAIVLNRGRTF